MDMRPTTLFAQRQTTTIQSEERVLTSERVSEKTEQELLREKRAERELYRPRERAESRHGNYRSRMEECVTYGRHVDVSGGGWRSWVDVEMFESVGWLEGVVV